MPKGKNVIVTDAGRVIHRDQELKDFLRDFLSDPFGPYKEGALRFKSHYPLAKEVRLAYIQYQKDRDLPSYGSTTIYTLNAHIIDATVGLHILKSAGTRISGLIPNPLFVPGDPRPMLTFPESRHMIMKMLHGKKIRSIEQLQTEYKVRPSDLAKIDDTYFLPEEYQPKGRATKFSYTDLDPDLFTDIHKWITSEDSPFRRATAYEVKDLDLSERLTINDIRDEFEKTNGATGLTNSRFIAYIRALTDSEEFAGDSFRYYGLMRKD